MNNVLARVLVTLITKLNKRIEENQIKVGHSFVTTYSLVKGIKKFRHRGKQAAQKEIGQLHQRKCWKLINKDKLTQEEKKALESLIFLVEKRDGTVKAKNCANRSTQRAYIDKHNAASPTVSTESTMLMATINAKEERDVRTADIPNAFI